MKALSMNGIFAFDIIGGRKTIECRSWKTNYRGDILICSNKQKSIDGMPQGYALGIAHLAGIHKFTKKDCEAAEMDNVPPNCWAWEIEHARYVKPFEVRGMPGLFEVDDMVQRDDTWTHFGEWFLPVSKPGSEFAKLVQNIDTNLRDLADQQ